MCVCDRQRETDTVGGRKVKLSEGKNRNQGRARANGRMEKVKWE